MSIELARTLCLLLALTCAFVAAAIYWRRSRTPVLAPAKRVAAKRIPDGIVYRDAPTVRVVDSQRADRLRKLVQLRLGESVDILEPREHGPPRFRITFHRVVPQENSDAAHLEIFFGGAAVSCGPRVQEVAPNEFIVPRSGRDDPRSCVFHYHEGKNAALDFMRIKVRSLDAQAGLVELSVLQVSGRWPG